MENDCRMHVGLYESIECDERRRSRQVVFVEYVQMHYFVDKKTRRREKKIMAQSHARQV